MRSLLGIGIIAVILGLACGDSTHAVADEGMWLLNQPPLGMMRDNYGFAPTPDWLEHVQKAALRFGGGASASFVSSRGLLLTNHHVARGQVAKLSRPDRDLLRDGFLALTPEEELRCPDAAVMFLEEIVDVTERVRMAVAAASSPAAAEAAHRAEIAAIETASQAETGLHSEVVTLYGGGLHHLYRYHRFTDVRLVFVPERAVAEFGGDVDNFEYPRWCLDVALLRVYDDHGVPFRPPHFLQVSGAGVNDGEPVFVAGHPGSTERQFTADHIRFLRDVQFPRQMRWTRTREVQLLVYASRGPRQADQARRQLGGFQNHRKGTGGKLRALQDPAVFAVKVAEETALREAVAARPDLAGLVGNAWDEIAGAQRVHEEIYDRYDALEGHLRHGFGGSDLVRLARLAVRLGEERTKPDAERLREYRESNVPTLELMLYSEAPFSDEFEINILENRFAYVAEVLGGEHPLVETMLDGLSPAERARALVQGSNLRDVAVRRHLVEGGPEAAASSDDAVVRFVRAVDGPAREIRRRYEDEVVAVERDAYARLATARFEVYGDTVYPDATGTLRLATGRVRGFDLEGSWADPFTDLGGLFRRFEERGPLPPFGLPERWLEARDRLDLSVPFNFVSTNDITGGNSGSPVVNRHGELVGLVFDGNRYGLGWDTVFEPERGRCVSVDARAIIEALGAVYGAGPLVRELLGE